jgi:two-component system, OmpR family, sensor kinase
MRLSSVLPTSIRWRLAIWVAAVLLISACITFVVVYRNTGHQLRAQIDRDLTGDTGQLSQVLALAGGRTVPKRIAAVARRYVSAQPYRSTSTLLFIAVRGGGTVSNHPEVFGSSGPEPGETSYEQARENALGRQLLVPRIGFSTHKMPDVGNVRLLERVTQVGHLPVLIGAGEPLALVERAQHGVAQAFLLAGALTLALALLASYLAGARVSAPLRRMARVATRVDAGDLEPRMVPPEGRRDEVRVLAEAFNHMLDRLSAAFSAQREFVADASHELRTPLTVIRGQLEVLGAQADPSISDVRRVGRLVEAEIGRISRLIDDLLLLAQSERGDFLRIELIDLGGFISELWEGLTVTAERRFELGSIPEGTLRADADRLAQALRNLVRNAIDHTTPGSGLVRIEIQCLQLGRVRFAVIDDGPGIAVAERERIFERFHRTDAARSRSEGGAGLGLAIVRAVAEAHNGTVHAARSEHGGARLELELPGFTAHAPDGRTGPALTEASHSARRLHHVQSDHGDRAS